MGRVNKFADGLKYHIRSLELRGKLGLKARAAGSLSNIAVIYKQMGRYKESIEYMTRAAALIQARAQAD